MTYIPFGGLERSLGDEMVGFFSRKKKDNSGHSGEGMSRRSFLGKSAMALAGAYLASKPIVVAAGTLADRLIKDFPELIKNAPPVVWNAWGAFQDGDKRKAENIIWNAYSTVAGLHPALYFVAVETNNPPSPEYINGSFKRFPGLASYMQGLVDSKKGNFFEAKKQYLRAILEEPNAQKNVNTHDSILKLATDLTLERNSFIVINSINRAIDDNLSPDGLRNVLIYTSFLADATAKAGNPTLANQILNSTGYLKLVSDVGYDPYMGDMKTFASR